MDRKASAADVGANGSRPDISGYDVHAVDVATSVPKSILEQALANVLDNAVKYSKTRGDIRVELQAASGFAVIRVIDAGPGMSDKEVQQMFEPFFRGTLHQATTPGIRA